MEWSVRVVVSGCYCDQAVLTEAVVAQGKIALLAVVYIKKNLRGHVPCI